VHRPDNRDAAGLLPTAAPQPDALLRLHPVRCAARTLFRHAASSHATAAEPHIPASASNGMRRTCIPSPDAVEQQPTCATPCFRLQLACIVREGVWLAAQAGGGAAEHVRGRGAGHEPRPHRRLRRRLLPHGQERRLQGRHKRKRTLGEWGLASAASTLVFVSALAVSIQSAYRPSSNASCLGTAVECGPVVLFLQVSGQCASSGC